MADLPAGKSKLIQYLNEAYGTERRLEVALEAHIGMATRKTYKKHLREHLTETRRHAREVSKRVKQLGGELESMDLPGPEALGGVAQSAIAGAQRVAALAQGPLHALRGTGEEEKQLKNAKTEYASEAEEIATYSAILTVAESLGDRDTAKLARAILREEERMSSFLEKEIPRMFHDAMPDDWIKPGETAVVDVDGFPVAVAAHWVGCTTSSPARWAWLTSGRPTPKTMRSRSRTGRALTSASARGCATV